MIGLVRGDLTPQPPSLRGKGEPESPVQARYLFLLPPSPLRRGPGEVSFLILPLLLGEGRGEVSFLILPLLLGEGRGEVSLFAPPRINYSGKIAARASPGSGCFIKASPINTALAPASATRLRSSGVCSPDSLTTMIFSRRSRRCSSS